MSAMSATMEMSLGSKGLFAQNRRAGQGEGELTSGKVPLENTLVSNSRY